MALSTRLGRREKRVSVPEKALVRSSDRSSARHPLLAAAHGIDQEQMVAIEDRLTTHSP
jgi:hypothetical protein